MNTQQLESIGISLLSGANEVVVSGEIGIQKASSWITEIKKEINKAKEILDPVVDSANKAHKEACNLRHKILDPFEDALWIVQKKINAEHTRLQKEESRKRIAAVIEAKIKEEQTKNELLQLAAQAETIDKEMANDILDKANMVVVTPEYNQVQSKFKTENNGTVYLKTVTKVDVTNLSQFIIAILCNNKKDTIVEINNILSRSDLNAQILIDRLISIRDKQLNDFVKINGIQDYPGLNIRQESASYIRGAK
jgi:hypothetical protein